MLNYRETKSTKPHWSLPVHHVNSNSENNDLERQVPLTKPLAYLHFWVHSYLFWYVLAIEIGTVTWKMQIDLETHHSCSETVSQFLLPCFDCLYSVHLKWAESRLGVPPWCWASPAHSPRVALGTAGPCEEQHGSRDLADPQPFPARAGTKTLILLHHHTHQLQINIKELWSPGLQTHREEHRGARKHWEAQEILFFILPKTLA